MSIKHVHVLLLVVAAGLVAPRTVAAATDLFLPTRTFDTGGNNLRKVVVADVNADGVPDLLAANSIGGLGVMLGNGDGTFQSPVVYPPGCGALAVADLNGDGKLDVAVTVWPQSTVTVLFGNGDGTFQPGASYFSGLNIALDVAIADVNGDGKKDVLVADCGPNGCSPGETGAVGVLLGNGDGSFRPVATYVGGQPVSIAVGDVNGDGRLDVAGANWALGTVGVLIGNGDGTFQPMKTYGAGASVPMSIALADLNGDGRLDMAVASFTDGNNPGIPVGILLGNGDGTFQPVVNYGSGGQERSAVTIADVTGDGIPDVLAASGCLVNDPTCAQGNIGVLTGNGDGTLQPAVLHASGGRFPVSIVAADLDADGRSDVVAANYGSGGDIGVAGVLLNNRGDSEPPIVTIALSSYVLWPPNGKLVPVTISGTITDTGSGVKASGAQYFVIDEYMQVHPKGPISVGPDGRYSVVVLLQASRDGGDRDGRLYIVIVGASDNAGNINSNQTSVVVPHDASKGR
jgi:hypothetical protein